MFYAMWCKVFVIYILLVISANLCVQAQKATSKDAKPQIDEKKLKEIAAIRDKLSKDLEKDVDMKTSGGQGVIVQPDWLQGSGNTKGTTKVVVTQKKLKETAAIREEIQDAVQSNTYAKGEPELNAAEADIYLGTKYRSKNVLSKVTGSSKDSYIDEEVGFTFEKEMEAGLPNVVESNALEDDIDIEKLKRLEMSSRRTREVLVLREIVEDLSFDLGEDVKEWEHFQHDGKEYFIGLRDADLLIIQKDDMKYEKGHVINVGAPILYLESFSFWNTESRQQQGLIVAAVHQKILWYQATSDEIFWQWSIAVPIKGLRCFKIDKKNYLAVSSEQSSSTGPCSLNIYQFDTKMQEFWIVQKLQLEHSTSEITFLDTGRDVVLAVVQNNSAVIFTFNPRSEVGDHIKFEQRSTIESEGIQSVSGFQMGGYSYLALGGLSPQILHYSHGAFVPKTIFGQNFGLVEMFLPVPARTYRDDLLLLVQHRVDFETHDLVVLETLIWDGEVFEATAPAPCVVGNHTIAHGVSCMLDLERDTGIKGSTILKRDNDIFIIVPRHKAESGLYQLKTELLAKNSELLDLKETFEYLKEWVNEQEDLTEEAYKFIGEASRSTDLNTEDDFSNLVSIKTSELDFSGNIGKIFVNEYEWTDEDMQVDLEDLIGAIERLDMELGHNDDIIRNRRELTYDTLDFDNVEAEDLLFQLLNGEQSYLKDSELIFDGAVAFESLKVLDEIRLSSARLVRDDTLEVDGDIKFDEINGIKWNDLVSDMVFRNEPLEIEELQVDGEVIVERDMTVSILNNLKFPDDFLWSSGSSSGVFRTEKNFYGSLTVNTVDTGGLINGVNPFDLITLSEAQNISGLTKFKQLEISEKMEVNGSVHGRGLNDFLSNPSLLETNIIHSACTFQQLEIRGPIQISDKFNGIDLDKVLNDIVYLPSKGEEISIKSKKAFNSILFGSNLELRENSLNGTPLNQFVTKNTQQELDMKSISGNVYFNNLTVTGQYDSVDINQLARDSVNADEDRIANAEIEFIDGIWAQSAEIVESLNGHHDFRTLQDDLELEEALFDELVATTVISECDITGDGTINNINLKGGRSDQSSAKLYVEELILESGLQVESLHNINTKVLLSFLEKVDNIPAMILEGKILVDHIHVDGDVQVNKLNAHSFDEDIQMTTIWLNRPNFLRTKVEFQDPIAINGDLKVNGSLNDFNFPVLIQDIAFKSENPITITAAKRFLTNFKVLGDADIESINGLPLIEIATKQAIEQFQGSVHINGDLLVESVEIIGFLNDYPIGGFAKSYRYDEDLKSIVLLGEVLFEGHTDLQNLHIRGKLNSIGNVNEFFENIVYRNKICMLKGKTTFTGNVTIEKGAYIKNINGYNVMQLMKNIVFINDPGPIFISAPVLFKDVIRAKDVTVKGSLNATNLMGCSLKEWIMDTLRVDRAADIGLLHLAEGVLDGNSLHTVYLNRMDMDYVVTLHTSQNISGYVSFSDAFLVDSISSGGLVNGINLLEEMENTLMTNGNQHITTPLTMQSCHVIRSLETNSIVNESKDLRQLAILHENLEFHSPMFFSKVTTNNVNTNDLISGIDFNQWYQDSLWTETRDNMVVTGNWTTTKLYVHSPSVRDYLMNGRTMDNMKRYMARPTAELDEQYALLYEAFAALCHRSKDLLKKAQNRIYFLKHLKKSFTLQEDSYINGVFPVSDTYHKYLIVNINCTSKIYLWDVENEVFQRISEFESGIVKEIVALPGKGETLHLVTNIESRDGCSYLGVNSWHFDRKKVTHLRSFNDTDISTIHHTSQGPDKFYAIDEKVGKVLQLTPNSTEKHSWNLPPSDSGSYRFLPHDADLGIALANGHQILLLNEPSRRRFRSKRDKAQHKFETRSKLPVGKELSFSDFSRVIERTLRDLIRRLNIQLTDINFTLSEGELQDEHLHRDFTDILEEIYKQKILTSEAFTDLNVELSEFSSNPVQILAARVILVVWPVLGELEEVHNHLRSNEHDHPICSGIFNSIRSAVHDLLQIAKFLKKNQTDTSSTTNMTEITTRIQDFQKEILETIDILDEDHNDLEQFTDTPPSSPEAPIQVHLLHVNTTAPNPLDEPFIGQAIPERNLLAADNPHLPARGAGEIVSIRTGMSGNYRILIAITEPKDHVIAGENDSVKIFFDVMTGSLFQSLSAYRPNCLTSTQILDESLFAFVEDKHMIRVLTYKGIRGFVEFVRFKVEMEVSALNFVSVSVQKEHECSRNFLMVSGGSNVDFFEIIMIGECGLEGNLECNEWGTY